MSLLKKAGSASDPLWYKDAIIYEIHVRAFMDSNGDGIGDFQGLLSKLDYLQDLGVTCLWLLPFFPSPLRDDGYDIANYTDVNPSYGTLSDFQEFLTRYAWGEVWTRPGLGRRERSLITLACLVTLGA